jgi:hypothetical protein
MQNRVDKYIKDMMVRWYREDREARIEQAKRHPDDGWWPFHCVECGATWREGPDSTALTLGVHCPICGAQVASTMT